MRSVALMVTALAATAVLGACRSEPGTATLPATPTATSGTTLTDTPLVATLNQTFEFAGLQVKVTEVVDPLASTESAYVPLPGHRFVGIGFEVNNPGGGPKPFSPAAEATLGDQAGGHYQMLLGQRAGDLVGQEIAAGATLTGRIAFELPDDRRPFLLELRRDGVQGADVKLSEA